MSKKEKRDKSRCTDCGVKLTEFNKTARYVRCKSCERERYKLPAKRAKVKHITKLIEDPNIRPVKGFNNKYLVSNTGDVYTTTEGGIRKLSPGINAAGYYLVCLFNKGEKSMQSVHRLVAKAFIENKSPYVNKIINHIDGIKTNNHYTNLEWTTFRGNSKHALRTGLQPRGEDIVGAKLSEEKVRFIYLQKRVKGDDRKNRLTQEQLAEKFGVTSRLIFLVQNRKVWKHVAVRSYRVRKKVNKKDE